MQRTTQACRRPSWPALLRATSRTCGVVLVALSSLTCGGGESPVPDAFTPAPDASPYQKDFAVIWNTLAANHPGMAPSPMPFAILAHGSDTDFRETYDRLAGVRSVPEFFLVVSRFLASLEDGHTSLRWYLSDAATIGLPVEFAVLDGDLYVVASYDATGDSLVNRRILSVNGVASRQLIDMADQLMSADRGRVSWKERLFGGSPRLLRAADFLSFAGVATADSPSRLVAALEDGGSMEVDLAMRTWPGRSFESLQNLVRNSITRYLPAAQLSRGVPEHDAVYVQLNQLPNPVDQAFLDDVFTQAIDRGSRHIVLDLRSNGGGDSRWGDAIVSYLIPAKRQITMSKAWARKGKNNDQISDGVTQIEPRWPGRYFAGRLWVLAGPQTFSSADWIVRAVQDNGLGTVVGEPTGNNSRSYGYVSTQSLPATGLVLGSSIRIFERASATAAGADLPAVPDVSVPTLIEHYRARVDPVWDYLALNLLK